MKGHKSFGFQLTKTIKDYIYIYIYKQSSSVLEIALQPPHLQPERKYSSVLTDKKS